MKLPALPRFPTNRLAARSVNLGTALHVRAYEVTGGVVGARLGSKPFLLLHHVGRKSGRERTTPLLYARDHDTLVIIASAGGMERHPAWWLNLRDRPDTEVQVGRRRLRVHAHEAEGEERERLWRAAVAAWPDYEVYQRRTSRRIPVIALDPR